MTPPQLIAAARGLLDRADGLFVGVWSRAAALLARQALEQSLDELWAKRGLAMERTSAHAQLLCLATYLGDDRTAAGARHAWWALSQACHHHPYELAPTREELARWLDVVADLVVEIERAPTTQAAQT